MKHDMNDLWIFWLTIKICPIYLHDTNAGGATVEIFLQIQAGGTKVRSGEIENHTKISVQLSKVEKILFCNIKSCGNQRMERELMKKD